MLCILLWAFTVESFIFLCFTAECASVSRVEQHPYINLCVVQEDGRFEQVTDVRAQLKFFEQLDQLEKQKKEEQEREILMKAAKVTHTELPVLKLFCRPF